MADNTGRERNAEDHAMERNEAGEGGMTDNAIPTERLTDEELERRAIQHQIDEWTAVVPLSDAELRGAMWEIAEMAFAHPEQAVEHQLMRGVVAMNQLLARRATDSTHVSVSREAAETLHDSIAMPDKVHCNVTENCRYCAAYKELNAALSAQTDASEASVGHSTEEEAGRE